LPVPVILNAFLAASSCRLWLGLQQRRGYVISTLQPSLALGDRHNDQGGRPLMWRNCCQQALVSRSTEIHTKSVAAQAAPEGDPMDLIVFLGIFVGLPILYLLLVLYWRLSSNHQPRLGTTDREVRSRDWHAGWFYGGDAGAGGDGGGPC
jgi:hypothetical protein